MVAQMAIDEVVEAWTLPLGSISRMIRAQSTHSPGHITDVGIGTYVDPALSGGAANEAAKKSPFHKELVTRVSINGQEQLMVSSKGRTTQCMRLNLYLMYLVITV
jgi:propionate CoA-transferase